ncbi:hypothetical protein [Nocardiopsis eucommiae]|uniref:TPR repeat region-containing protein n=1 Tax=Nocardiopsis eucommiae TaxID=2831970 RepID=UPI003D74FE54
MYFSPKPCDVDTGKLDQAADDALNIVGRITGKSGDLKALFDDGAKEFSDLVASDIHATANENFGAWTSALATCWHVWGVLTKWSGDVERYKEKISGLQEEWDAAVASNFGFDLDDGGVVEARKALAGALNDRAEGFWSTLEEEADENSSNLQGGPTVANLRELIDAGVLGFAAYNATRQILYYPSTFDTGERDGETLLPYLNGEKEPDEEYYRLIEQLAAINALAADAKRNGDPLRDFQVEYLEEFYAALDEGSENGVPGIPGQLSGETLSVHERDKALSALGDGLLVLSDEKVGGGYGVLPESVRAVAEGADFSGDRSGRGAVNIFNSWMDQAEGLNELLSHSREELEGGAQFSTTVAVAVGEGIERLELLGRTDDSVMSGLLTTATRNEDANFALLTGSYPDGVDADLPWPGEGEHAEQNRINTLKSLFTHDWGDEGEAARGVTDWISDGPADGEGDSGGRLREDALMGLMELMDHEGFKDSMFNTGSHVTDDYGDTWHDVSAGQLNPEIADGFAEIFIAFQEEFSNTDGLPNNQALGLGEGLEFTPESRVSFVQLAVGDSDAASKVYTESLLNTARAMEEYANNTGMRTQAGSVEAGSLQGLVEVALMNESITRGENDKEFVEYRNKINTSVINILGGSAGDGGAPGLVVELGKIVAQEALEVSETAAEPHVPLNGDWVQPERLMGYAVGVAAKNDAELMEELSAEGVAKKDDSGSLYVSPDHAEWDKSGSDVDLLDFYGRIEDDEWPDGEGSTKNAVEAFLRGFGTASGKWEHYLET